MLKQTEQDRQLKGCGYLPPPPENLRPYVQAWDGTSLGRTIESDERDENKRVRLPVCPGYVCSLPEVLETSWAASYWEKGELSQFCEGQSTPQLRDAIHTLLSEQAAVSEWSSANPEKK